MKNRQCFHLLFLFTFLSLFLIVSSTTPNPNTTAAEDTKEEEANDDEPEAEATTVTVDPAAFPMKSRMRRLKMERHTSNKFNLLSIRTSLESHLPYSSLPRIGSKQGSMNEAELLREMTGTTDCDVMLSIYLLRGKRRGLRNMCVYRIKTEEEIFQKGLTINMEGKEVMTLQDLHEKTSPIRGFLVGDLGSVVRGYIVKGFFYGTLKLLDRTLNHHVHFYVEPFRNALYYMPDWMWESFATMRKKEDNAILFEYIPQRGTLNYFFKTEEEAETETTTEKEKELQKTANESLAPESIAVVGSEVKGRNIQGAKVSIERSTSSPEIVNENANSNATRNASVNANATSNGSPTTQKPPTTTKASNTTTLDPSYILKMRSKRYPPYHSTVAVAQTKVKIPLPYSRGKREAPEPTILETAPSDPAKADLYQKPIPLSSSLSNGLSIFGKSNSAFFLPTCVWIQPNFASIFSFQADTLEFGINEVFDILRMVNWILRSQDFTGNGISNNLGLKIVRALVSDRIQLNPTEEEFLEAKKSDLNFLMGLEDEEGGDDDEEEDRRKRKRRRKRWVLPVNPNDPDSFKEENYPDEVFEPDDLDYTEDATENMNYVLQFGEGENLPVGSGAEGSDAFTFTRMIYNIPAGSAYARLAPILTKEFKDSRCGIILAFLYHEFPGRLSVTTKNGACTTPTNVALISGIYDSIKLGKFDLVRSVFHSVAHLLGADHLDEGSDNCVVKLEQTLYLDPALMRIKNYVNVGLRPSSLRLSSCSKLQISVFLSSDGASCIRQVDETPFCGNGLMETNEACDCGGPAACRFEKCCGERDSVFPCRRLDEFRNGNKRSCRRIQKMPRKIPASFLHNY